MSVSEVVACSNWFVQAQKQFLTCKAAARAKADDDEKQECYCVLSLYNTTAHMPTGDGTYYQCNTDFELEENETERCMAYEPEWAFAGTQAVESSWDIWSWLPSFDMGPAVSRFGPLLAFVALLLVVACLVFIFYDRILAILWNCTGTVGGVAEHQGDEVLGLASWCDDACRREVAAHRERKRRRKERRLARRKNRNGEMQPLQSGQEDASSGAELTDSSEDSSDAELEAGDQLPSNIGATTRSSRQDARGSTNSLQDVDRQGQLGEWGSGGWDRRGESLPEAGRQQLLGNESPVIANSSGQLTFDSPKAKTAVAAKAGTNSGAWNRGTGTDVDVRIGNPTSSQAATVATQTPGGAVQPFSAPAVVRHESPYTTIPFPAGQGHKVGGMFQTVAAASSGHDSGQRQPRTFQA